MTVGAALALSTIAVTVLLIAYEPLFMVNDDVAMESFANGDYSGSPSRHLVFLCGIVGLLLATLYRLSASVPWFGLSLYAAQVVSFAGIAVVMFRRRHSIGVGPGAAACVAFAVFVPILTLRLSFTASATLAAVFGIILAAYAATIDGPAQKWCALAAIIALDISAMLRWDAFVASMVVFAPILLLAAGRARLRKSLVAGALLLLLLGFSLVANTFLQSRGDWSEFTEYNEVRGRLHGTETLSRFMSDRESPELRAVLEANSWAFDDLLLFNSWFFDNAAVFSKERLQRLADAAGDELLAVPLDESFRSVTGPHRGLLLSTVGFAGAVGVVVGGSRRRLMVAVQQLWALGIFTVTASRQRFPDRVSMPMFFGLAIVLTVGLALVTARSDVIAGLPTRLRRAGAGFAIVAATSILVHIQTQGRYDAASLSEISNGAAASLANQMRALDLVDPDGRFVFVGPAVETELISPLSATTPFASGRLLGLGWPTFSPLFETRKSRMGLGDNLMAELVVQDDVYLVAYPSLMAPIVRAYDRWYQLDVDLVDVGEVATGARIYEVRAATSRFENLGSGSK